MVDLRGMEPSGVNGGLQTYIEWQLPWLAAHHRAQFSFLALAGLHNVALVSSLLGTGDVVCVAAPQDAIWQSGGQDPTIVASSMTPKALLQKIHVDALYAPLGPLPFEKPSIPSVALVADMLHRELPETLKPEVVAHRERYLTPTIRDATLIQCISRSAQERLEHHYPEISGRTFVTYLPVQSRLQQGPTENHNPLIPSRPYFFYPANFWPHKNHRLLVNAYHAYVCEAGDTAWDLVLSGSDYDGNLRQMRDLAASVGLSGKILFPGYVNEITLAALWKHASALVFPSLHEGFGIPLLEAMAAGLPILSANGYSLPEVAGDAALYFDPRDASQMTARMLDITSRPELRATLTQKGRVRLRSFDAEAESVKLVAAFCRILAPHTKSNFASESAA